MTFIEASDPTITRQTLEEGKRARGHDNDRFPEFLMVPRLSSERADDRDIVHRGQAALANGGEGLIVSGTAIRACREAFPDTTLVSPGIRPAGSLPDDHRRWTTPADAIRYSADYLVIGRPILRAPSPQDVAQRVIDEIARA